MKKLVSIILLTALLLGLCACSDSTEVYRSDAENASWTVGFGSYEIIPDDIEANPLYIAGYNSGWLTNTYLDNNELEVYDTYREPSDTPDYDSAYRHRGGVRRGASADSRACKRRAGLHRAAVRLPCKRGKSVS